MKIESRVILSKEDLETISKAWEILCDFHSESIRVLDPMENLRTAAEEAYHSIDIFLGAYEDVYEAYPPKE